MNGAQTLNKAAASIALNLHDDEFMQRVADWFAREAVEWWERFEATQRPSRGVDDPPAINHGIPHAAELNADWHARYALAAARAYLEVAR